MSLFVVASLGPLLSLSACSKGTQQAKEDIALVPKEADMVFGVNFTRMRGTPMWKKITDFAGSATDQKALADNCVDITSAEGPESAFLALPSPGGGATAGSNDGIIVIRLHSAVDDAKIAKCFDYVAKKANEQVATSEYGGKKIYGSVHSGAGEKGGFAQLDGKTIVFGTGTWLHRAIDLAAGKDTNSAKTNDALVALVKSAKTQNAIWGAGIVPQSARDSFKNDPKMATMTALKSVVGDVDFVSGLTVDLNLDMGTEADAKAINTQAQQQIADLKKSPQVMMLGMGAWLDGIKTDAKGASFNVNIKLAQPQVDEMITRVQGLLNSFGNSLSPGLGGGMGAAPPMGMPGAPGTSAQVPGGLQLGAPTPPSGVGTPGAPPHLGLTPGLAPPTPMPKTAPPPPAH